MTIDDTNGRTPRRRDNLITFVTDFGRSGGYVAVCEAVILSIAPTARVLHLSHEIAAGDIAAGALVLERVTPFCPPGVHVAVIDPGVGTTRVPLALLTQRGDILLGPDNGLLLPAARELGGIATAWSLDVDQLRRCAGLSTSTVSNTFHGRDVFAPAAALLSAGSQPDELGTELATDSLVKPRRPGCRRTPDGVSAEVVEIDRFGNVELAVRFDELALDDRLLTVEIEEEDLPVWNGRVVETFAQLQPGELGILRDSWGYAALAMDDLSAAQVLAIERGMSVRLTVRNTKP